MMQKSLNCFFGLWFTFTFRDGNSLNAKFIKVAPSHKSCRKPSSEQRHLCIVLNNALCICIFAIHIYRVTINKRVEKSNHIVWHQNRVKLLFFAHQLGGNIHPFILITITNPWCYIFSSKLNMQKMLRNAQK